MTRLEKLEALAQAASRLPDEQLDDMLAVVQHVAAPASVFETLAPEHQAQILKAKADAVHGIHVQSTEAAFASIDAKLKGYGA